MDTYTFRKSPVFEAVQFTSWEQGVKLCDELNPALNGPYGTAEEPWLSVVISLPYSHREACNLGDWLVRMVSINGQTLDEFPSEWRVVRAAEFRERFINAPVPA